VSLSIACRTCRLPLRVISRNPHTEQKFSGLPLKADLVIIALRSQAGPGIMLEQLFADDIEWSHFGCFDLLMKPK
jgi:hypothetical protein